MLAPLLLWAVLLQWACGRSWQHCTGRSWAGGVGRSCRGWWCWDILQDRCAVRADLGKHSLWGAP